MKNVISYIVLLFYFLFPTLSISQPYAPFQPGRIAHYRFYDPNMNQTRYFVIFIDSIFIQLNDTLYLNYFPWGEDNPNFPGNCFPFNNPSWLGLQVVKKNNGEYYFINLNNDSIVLKTRAGQNDSWIFYRFPDGSYLQSTMTGFDFDTILTSADSIKIILLQKKDSIGNNINSDFNDKEILISKTKGLVKTFNFLNFPSDTSEKILAGITNYDEGIANLTPQSIFNYDIGDIFHIDEFFSTSPWMWPYSSSHSLIKRVVIDKTVINDTINFTYFDSIWRRNFFNDGVIFGGDTIISTDTAFESVYLLDSSLNKLSYEPLINYNSWDGFSYMYLSNDYNIKRIKVFLLYLEYNSLNNCWAPVPDVDNSYYYIEGCGGKYFDDDNWDSNSVYKRNLVYFKKSTEEWGAPIVFPGIDERDFGKVKITLSPNPFSEKAVLEIQGMNEKQVGFDFEVYDLLGKKLINYRDIKSRIEVDRNDLSSGIYFYKLFADGVLISTDKIIIE